MMYREAWIQNILEPVEFLSDANHQYRAWITHEFNYRCHFEEIICQLYDDGDLDNFIDNYAQQFNITKAQVNKLKILRDKIDVFCEREDIYYKKTTPRKVNEEKVLKDPYWKEIQLASREVLKAFNWKHS